MANYSYRERKYAPSIYEISKSLKKGNILPVYYLFGQDDYELEAVIKELRHVVEPLVSSDFDKEVLSADKGMHVNHIIDLASGFPFGGEKKMLIVKHFEVVPEKKVLAGYVNNPAQFTVLIIHHHGKIQDFSREPFKSLYENQFIFEAKDLRGNDFIPWIIKKAEELKLIISAENSHLLLDMVGEDKSLIENQLVKFSDFLSVEREVDAGLIKSLSSRTKGYTIFDLQDALGVGKKSKALEIAYNLVDNGTDLVFILNMLSKFIIVISRSLELSHKKVADTKAASMLKVSKYYYDNCRKARYFLDDARLNNASKALIETDIALKSTSADPKSLITILIGEMLKD